MIATMLKRFAYVSALLACAGCGGVGIQIFGFPNNPQPGQPVQFNIKLTNHGLCPVDSAVGVSTFFTDQQIISGSGTAGEVLIQLLCNGAIAGGGEQCTLSGDTITCTFPIPSIPLGAPEAPTQQNFSLTPPGLPQPIPCTQTGGTIQCQIPAVDRQAFSFSASHQHASLPSPGAPVSCGPASPPFAEVCLVPTMNAGDMTTFDVTLTSPLAVGTFRTFAFVQQTDGVCQGGSNQGQPCDTGGTDCTGGTCQSSICTSGADTGFGCATDSNCMGGGTGSCQPCFTQGPDSLVTPLGCDTTRIGPEGAPAASRTGLLTVVAALFVLGVFLLQRQRRRTN